MNEKPMRLARTTRFVGGLALLLGLRPGAPGPGGGRAGGGPPRPHGGDAWRWAPAPVLGDADRRAPGAARPAARGELGRAKRSLGVVEDGARRKGALPGWLR